VLMDTIFDLLQTAINWARCFCMA